MTIVPTYFFIYIVRSREDLKLEFVKECKTKGEAIRWIKEQGSKDSYYTIQEFYKP